MGLLKEIPEVPSKTGWPWTVEFAETEYTNSYWPKISIVTPSFNQGKYLEETIRSILLQNYPNLEYIIIDGGSSDETINIIAKYNSWISYWVSESDRGQVHGINKGLNIVSGEVFNWINSDDYLTSGALKIIGKAFMNDVDLVAGSVNNFSSSGNVGIFGSYYGIVKNQNFSLVNYFLDQSFYFHQPGVWYNKNLLNGLNISEEFNYCFDSNLLLKILETKVKINYIEDVLVNFRLHDGSKTVGQQNKFFEEFDRLHYQYAHHDDPQISKMAMQYILRNNWRHYLNELQKSPEKKARKIVNIFKGILINPKVRLNKFSLGCIKVILLN